MLFSVKPSDKQLKLFFYFSGEQARIKTKCKANRLEVDKEVKQGSVPACYTTSWWTYLGSYKELGFNISLMGLRSFAFADDLLLISANAEETMIK